MRYIYQIIDNYNEEDLTCLNWPCHHYLFRIDHSALFQPSYWLIGGVPQPPYLPDNFQVVSRPRQLIDLFPLLLSFPGAWSRPGCLFPDGSPLRQSLGAGGRKIILGTHNK